MELTGRWMDKRLGAGSAKRNAGLFEAFIEDGRVVRISWGDLLCYTGIIEDLSTNWESQSECAWTLKILIDTNEFEGENVTVQSLKSPTQVADDVQQWLNTALPNLPKQLPNLDAVTGEVFDALDDMVASVTQYGGAAVKAANAVSNWETAGFAELARLQAGLHQFKTAVLTLQSTVENLAIDTLVVDRAAEDDIAWLTFQTQSEKQTNSMLHTITAGQLEAQKAVARSIKTTHTASDGDSWESISSKFYGSPDGADKVRQANGVRGGEKPQAGRTYSIPHS